jgi:ketosteroid isomerase-like protein
LSLADANERFVRDFYQLFARGDAERAAHLFADDFLFIPAGKRAALAQPRRGSREIFEFTRRQMEVTQGTWIPRPYDIVAGDRHVVVLVVVEATRGPRRCTFRLVHVWTIVDDVARELHSYVDDQYLYDEFLA